MTALSAAGLWLRAVHLAYHRQVDCEDLAGVINNRKMHMETNKIWKTDLLGQTQGDYCETHGACRGCHVNKRCKYFLIITNIFSTLFVGCMCDGEYFFGKKYLGSRFCCCLSQSRLPKNLGFTKQLVQSFVGLRMEIGLNGI